MDKPVIRISKDIVSGTPVFYGTRVPVQSLIDWLVSGDTIDDWLDNFPSVKREQAVRFLNTAAQAAIAVAMLVQEQEGVDEDTTRRAPAEKAEA